MFAPALWAENGVFNALTACVTIEDIGDEFSAEQQERLDGAAPVVFGPCMLARTWGTLHVRGFGSGTGTRCGGNPFRVWALPGLQVWPFSNPWREQSA
jgi:hypothetical protein